VKLSGSFGRFLTEAIRTLLMSPGEAYKVYLEMLDNGKCEINLEIERGMEAMLVERMRALYKEMQDTREVLEMVRKHITLVVEVS
jgi:hypothetical protein